MELSESVHAIEPPANVRVEGLPDNQGHRRKLTWTASPSESVEWYRIFRSRSHRLTDPIPMTQFSSIDSLNFWDEHYTILIDSVAVGVSEYIDFVPLNGELYYYWLQAVGNSNESHKVSADIVTSVEGMPSEFRVSAPYPNPFNQFSVIRYELPVDRHVELVIYDILGREIIVLRDGEDSAGIHEAVWDGKNENGENAGSGVYLFRLKTDVYIAQGKVLLLR